ncbi:MAG TPA: hypothetical protein VHM88_12850 [Candidatus Acidoferrales bacterium]|nr:hypothetical protein [Candidatus Acidoferrales bacterium]
MFRALRGRLFAEYPVFYSYFSYVFVQSFAAFYLYRFHPGVYANFYWYTQFLSVALGYGIIWEIFRQALKHYPGTARATRSVLAVVFILVLLKVLSGAVSSSVWSPARAVAELERSLRVVQAALLVTIVGVLAYYTIPVGRNLKGMIVGYGFFIGARVISLTLGLYFAASFQPVWQRLPAMTYYIVLIIWCSTLWSYRPSPQPESDVGIERDYESVVARTTNALLRARAHLVKAVRP